MDEPLFNSPEEEMLFQSSHLAEVTRTFLLSELGEYLREKAFRDVKEAGEAMLKVSYWNKRKILRLQAKAAAAQNFIKWMNEAMIEGDNAHYQLKAMNQQG